MLIFDQLNKGERPLRLLAWAVFGGLLLLAFGLWRIQILNGPRYREIQQVQSFRSIRIPAVRGRILDRDGRVLADTRPHYRLDLYLDELKLQFETEHRRLRKAALAARGVVNIPTPGFWARLAARFQRAKLATPLTVNENEQLRRQARYLVVSNLMANERTIGCQRFLLRNQCVSPLVSSALPPVSGGRSSHGDPGRYYCRAGLELSRAGLRASADPQLPGRTDRRPYYRPRPTGRYRGTR